jgi:hypothetical protein
MLPYCCHVTRQAGTQQRQTDRRLSALLDDLGVGGRWKVKAKRTNTFRALTLRMRWASRVARMGNVEVYTGKYELVKHLEQLGSV